MKMHSPALSGNRLFFLMMAISIGLAALAAYAVEDTRELRRELERNKEALTRHEHNLAILNAEISSQVPWVATDDQLKITIWNQAAEGKFGWTQGELLGKSLDVLMPNRQIADKHHKALAEKSIGEFIDKRIGLECYMPSKTGEFKRVYVQIYHFDLPPSRYLAVIHNPITILRIGKTKFIQ